MFYNSLKAAKDVARRLIIHFFRPVDLDFKDQAGQQTQCFFVF